MANRNGSHRVNQRRMPGRAKRRRMVSRMDIDVERLISEVHARTYMWDSTAPGYTSRQHRKQTWWEIAALVYPDWDKLSTVDQMAIAHHVETRWASVRDRFMREHRKLVRNSGTSPVPLPAIPYAEQLSFLLLGRGLWPTWGNAQEDSDLPEFPQHQLPTLSGSADVPDDIEGGYHLVGPLGGSIKEEPDARDSEAADTSEDASSHAAADPVTAPPTRTFTTCPPPCRTVRRMDRGFELEDNVPSVSRRVDTQGDMCQNVGNVIALRCRQLQGRPLADVITVSMGVVAAYEDADPDHLPDPGYVVDTVRTLLGLHSYRPNVALPRALQTMSTTTQTPVCFLPATAPPVPHPSAPPILQPPVPQPNASYPYPEPFPPYASNGPLSRFPPPADYSPS
ncbi:uncharacterized protein [Dendropsophus ebraccatus]|uniref:uncharacterized protein n=1 Tax=Dendropsophus ebraccatus TaxID=150705 RepID=UPI0038320B32